MFSTNKSNFKPNIHGVEINNKGETRLHLAIKHSKNLAELYTFLSNTNETLLLNMARTVSHAGAYLRNS
jgi:hypothetical protein